eukprot:m51a1_g4585 hypothetical protein (300) ;mRNA; r:179182-180142
MLAALSLAVCAVGATWAKPLVVCSSADGLHGFSGGAFATVAPPATAKSSSSFFGLVAATPTYTYFTSEGQNLEKNKIRRMRHETREISEVVEMRRSVVFDSSELLVDEDGDWMVWTEDEGAVVRSCRLSNCTATAKVQSSYDFQVFRFQWMATGIVGMAIKEPTTDTRLHLLNLETGATSTIPSGSPACPVPVFRDPDGFLWNTCRGSAYRNGTFFRFAILEGEFVDGLAYDPIERRLVFICSENTICVSGRGPSSTVEYRHRAGWMRGCSATTPPPIPHTLVVQPTGGWSRSKPGGSL